MNDAKLVRLLTEAVELLDRSRTVISARLVDISDAFNGHPRSGALDSVGGRGKTTFCEAHGRERCPCGAGTPYANLSDPTGDAATRPDRAAEDRKRLEAALVSIERQAQDVVRLLGKYQPRPATDREIRETLRDNERGEACASCARLEAARGVRRWEPVFRGDLCRWCYDHRGGDPMPAKADVERYHRGVRVRRPA